MGKIRINDTEIRDLAKLLEETGLTEIELGSGSERIRVVRQSIVGRISSTPAEVLAGENAGDSSNQELDQQVDASHPDAVSSPMVGTVYLAPEPGSKPFVVAGDEVSAGDTMFIIEAMKTMNPVTAPKAGRVEKVLVGNATPVEYGEVLALLS